MDQGIESQSCLYFCIGRALVIGSIMPSEMHHLAVIEITASLDHPFSIRMENENWVETRAVIVDANVPHQLKDFHGQQITLTIVPERRWGKYLQKYVLNGAKIKYLDHLDLSSLENNIQEILKNDYDCPTTFGVGDQLIDLITGIRGFKDRMDDRILNVLNRIQQSLSEPISAKKLARGIFLSEGRFLHLFKEQLGLPLRQYILYQRIMVATREFLRGKSLTEAAYEAGFSDSAHFTRTFIEMNGMKPSTVAKLKENYRVHCCESLCDACNPKIRKANGK